MNFSRHLRFTGGLRRVALPTALAAFAVVLPACAGRVYHQAQSVVVTAVPLKVAHCRAVGPVQAVDEGGGGTIDDRMLALKEAAVVIGGNTVLVRSPGTSVDGTAYVCQPPVKPDNVT